MITVELRFENQESIIAKKPSGFAVNGPMELPEELKAAVDTVIAEVAAVASKLGGSCRANAVITQENDKKVSIMFNVAQL